MNKYDLIIIGAGPSGLALAQCYHSENNQKRILIIDKESDIGGCHRVRRVFDPKSNELLFTEHGPRIYSDTYSVFSTLLQNMGINFYDYFTPYNFTISQIGGETIWTTITFRELFIFSIEFFKLLINNNYGNNVTMKTFLLQNTFASKSIDLIDRICRLTDGAGIEKYSLNEFLQLFNQQFFHTIYQPKLPNDIGIFKIWKNHLLKNNVSFLLNSKVTSLNTNITNDKIVSITLDSNQTIYCDKVVLAIPPINIVNLFTISNNKWIQNSFGDFNKLKHFSNRTAYIDYISVTFHWNTKLVLPKIHGFPKTTWGVAYIVLSDYMTFTEKTSKTVISAAITITHTKSSTINKTANECSNINELINEIFTQLKQSFPNLPPPTISLLSPGLFYDNYSKKWTSIDTAYISNYDHDFQLDFTSKTITNLFNVGTHNNKSLYKFTSLESAVTNAVHLSHILNPKLKHLFPITSTKTVKDFIVFIIIIISIIFLYYKIKNKTYK